MDKLYKYDLQKEGKKKLKREKAYKVHVQKTNISQPLLGELSTHTVHTSREGRKYSGGEALMSAMKSQTAPPL